ncbi:unnamed protein product [Vitrella brassicaformis CCMP3155]|uniref:Uncharacterized protein n=1 Tax=Vitrella brassicaformis (strain CCMP3155) TaxID=1169540 RepID=A0A0G4FQY7_VITBC|nr:unnamed protein product [Vitrella brassicaformis CCMP3155]|eukprot:CEM16636.1 unnamed protein product [Vitrella brassicaformis CCMP3155]
MPKCEYVVGCVESESGEPLYHRLDSKMCGQLTNELWYIHIDRKTVETAIPSHACVVWKATIPCVCSGTALRSGHGAIVVVALLTVLLLLLLWVLRLLWALHAAHMTWEEGVEAAKKVIKLLFHIKELLSSHPKAAVSKGDDK